MPSYDTVHQGISMVNIGNLKCTPTRITYGTTFPRYPIHLTQIQQIQPLRPSPLFSMMQLISQLHHLRGENKAQIRYGLWKSKPNCVNIKKCSESGKTPNLHQDLIILSSESPKPRKHSELLSAMSLLDVKVNSHTIREPSCMKIQ